MAAPTAPALSRLFTQLTGRDVAFVQAKEPRDARIPQVYGVYRALPEDIVVIVKADLPLLGSFAGALIGLPDPEVKVQLRTSPLGEALRDAISEVLNIANSEIAPDRRAVLSKVVTDLKELDEAASTTLTQPGSKYFFDVSIKGYQGGKFAIMLQSAPAS
jgi:hypothetical protein